MSKKTRIGRNRAVTRQGKKHPI